MIILTAAGIKNSLTHIFNIRVIVSLDELVCIVENTKCHVKLASIAMSIVSLSLISQTIIISGSCLNAVLSHLAKVYQISGLT